MSSVKEKTINGILWSSIERFSVQGVQLLVMLVMARLLSPEEFGLIGMLAIFIAISQSFIDSGFANALIRKLDRTEVDYSTVFYFNIVVGLICYLILFFAAPFIANFYEQPILVPLTRVLAVNLIVNSLTVVQRAKFTAEVDFKTQAKASFVAVIVSGIIGIWMAYRGYGVWSLAVQQVVNAGISMIALWFMAHWRPKWAYSWQSFRELFSFGSKLLLSGLIDTTYRNLYLIVIGKVFTPTDLGYFTQAQKLSEFPSSNLTGVLQRVTYPILSNIQDEDERLRLVYRQYLKLSAFVIFPLMIGLASLAEPAIKLILGEKWLPAVPLLQLLCLSMMWYPIHSINLNLLQVKGRSDLFLRLEIIKKVIGVTVMALTIPHGIATMCAAEIVTSIVCLGINTFYTGKLINVGFLRQMGDLLPILIQSLVMGAIVYAATLIVDSAVVDIIIGICVGVAFYLLVSFLTKNREYNLIKNLIKK